MADWLSALEEWLDYVLHRGDYAVEFPDYPPYLEQDPSAPPLPAETPRAPALSSPLQPSARLSSPRLGVNSQHSTSSTSMTATDPSSSEKSQHKTSRHPSEQQEEPPPEKPQHKTVSHLPEKQEEPLSQNPQRLRKRSLHRRLEEKPVQMACRLAQYLSNCLPIRSFFTFQVLSGISSCSNKSVIASLVFVLGIACFISCFTDSSNVHGRVYFRLVTCLQSETTYRLPRCGIRPSDFVHAAMSMAVYGALVFSDRNVMDALYPCASGRLRLLLQWVRLVVVVSSSFFLIIFPTCRRGIGFAVADAATSCNCDENFKGSREQKKTNGLP